MRLEAILELLPRRSGECLPASENTISSVAAESLRRARCLTTGCCGTGCADTGGSESLKNLFACSRENASFATTSRRGGSLHWRDAGQRKWSVIEIPSRSVRIRVGERGDGSQWGFGECVRFELNELCRIDC